jgi:hypothetical protein
VNRNRAQGWTVFKIYIVGRKRKNMFRDKYLSFLALGFGSGKKRLYIGGGAKYFNFLRSPWTS